MAGGGVLEMARPVAVKTHHPLRRQELVHRHFRFRDIVDANETHLTDGDKKIGVFTEHVVELHVAHRHVRVRRSDKTFVDVEAVRLTVRDVDRRRARMEDPDCVMNVLTENVKTSELVSKCLTNVNGECLHTTERSRNTTNHEKVEFGDVSPQEAAPGAHITLPDHEEIEEALLQGHDTVNGDQTVTFQEIPWEEYGLTNGVLLDGVDFNNNRGKDTFANIGNGCECNRTAEDVLQQDGRATPSSFSCGEGILPCDVDIQESTNTTTKQCKNSCGAQSRKEFAPWEDGYKRQQATRKWSRRSRQSSRGHPSADLNGKCCRRPPHYRKIPTRGTYACR